MRPTEITQGIAQAYGIIKKNIRFVSWRYYLEAGGPSIIFKKQAALS